MSLKSRLARLERDHGCAGPCSPDTARPTYTVFCTAGEPIPPVPADAPTSPRCGEVHLFVIEIAEAVVEPSQ